MNFALETSLELHFAPTIFHSVNYVNMNIITYDSSDINQLQGMNLRLQDKTENVINYVLILRAQNMCCYCHPNI